MIGAFNNWLDQRTGYRKFLSLMLIEHIPGGAKWRYVWGSCLAFVFAVQLITGVLLMTAYAPSDTSAWGSVYFIQYEMDFGWLIRGLHHFGSQTMVVLLAIHMLQVVIAGAHLPPREVKWWLGILLMAVVLGLSLTGYLLPWDQKGFFATQVATNIAGSLPVVGSALQKFLVGGPTYGNATLSRFFTLHVWVLPFTLIFLLVLHVVAFRRHGITHAKNPQGTGWFWPDQAFRDLIVCLVIFGIMVSLVVFGGHGNKIETPAAVDAPAPGLYEQWAHAGKRGLGANLDAPADPLTEGYPARPEWYFLFLFQLLKYFEGGRMLIGTVAIPNGALLLLLVLPLLGYKRMRAFGHWVGVLVVVGLIGGVIALTVLAMADDSPTPYPLGIGGGSKEAIALQQKLRDADAEAKRAVQMASEGIPIEGAREMLRRDPLTRGAKRFEANCAGCHSYTPADKNAVAFNDPKAKFSAADLGDYASEAWIRGLLKNPGDDKYFGRTELGGMKSWRKSIDRERAIAMKKDEAAAVKLIAQEDADFDALAKFLAQQSRPVKDRDARLDDASIKLFATHCSDCHMFRKDGGTKGPNLTDYGSQDWIRLMIAAPYHESRYGERNRMPAFRDFKGPGGDIRKLEFAERYDKKGDDADKKPAPARVIELSDVDRELIVRWLTRDYRSVFGGGEISGPVRRE